MDGAAKEVRQIREQFHVNQVQITMRLDSLEERLNVLSRSFIELRRSTIQVQRRVRDRKKHEELWNSIPEIRQRYEAKIRESLEYHLRNKRRGRVRVAQLPHFKDLGLPLPITFGYVNVLISRTNVNKSKNFLDPINVADELAPDCLCDSRGRLYVNLISFSHCYARVRLQSHVVGWSWPSAAHIDANDDLTEDYFNWRRRGSSHQEPVPYPTGLPSSAHYTPPQFCLWPATAEIDNPAVDYYNFERTGSVKLRPGWEFYSKAEYPLYADLAKKTKAYQLLAGMLAEGKNLQLICHDAPQVLVSANRLPTPPFDRVLPGICGENGAKSLEIDRDAVLALRALDLEHMSHGYSLAIALLGGDTWLN